MTTAEMLSKLIDSFIRLISQHSNLFKIIFKSYFPSKKLAIFHVNLFVFPESWF